MMTVDDLKDKIEKLVFGVYSMTREFYEIKNMVSQGVCVSLENNYEIVFGKDGLELCRCSIESKDNRKIIPRDVKSAMEYFTPKNRETLEHEMQKYEIIETDISGLEKKIKVMEKIQDLQCDFEKI